MHKEFLPSVLLPALTPSQVAVKEKLEEVQESSLRIGVRWEHGVNPALPEVMPRLQDLHLGRNFIPHLSGAYVRGVEHRLALLL